MKLQKDFTTQLFADYFQNNTNGTHFIKLVVDDISFDVNKFILNCWSEEFEFKSDEDNEIFLTQFDGHKEEIKLCVDLLHGKEIHVDISNVAVILKFAAMFKVSDMINIVMEWFQENITLTSFLDISCITYDFNKVGYKFNQLFEIIRTFIEENTESCIKSFTDYFVVNISFVIDLLIFDGFYIGECISLFNSETRTDADYKYMLEKIELVLCNNRIILVEQSAVLNQLLDKVMEEVNDPDILKKYMKIFRNVLVGKPGLSYEPERSILKFQSWRRLSKVDLLYLQNIPDVKEYQYAAICIDWIQERKPEQDVVLELFNSIKKEKLGYRFVECIWDSLYNTLQCYNLPYVEELLEYEFEHQRWFISEEQLLDCLNNNTAVQLSDICFISNCTNKRTLHTVNIRLVNTSGKVSVQIKLPVHGGLLHSHSSDRYVFWYLAGWSLDYDKFSVYTFHTNNCSEILEFCKNLKEIYLRCLLRKCY